MGMVRKKRKDRRHIVYRLYNMVSGEFYIGVTQGFRQKDLQTRVIKHFQRALVEDKQWKLCVNIRDYGPESFTWSIIEVIRGKTEAHKKERELTKLLNPALNTQ